MSFLNQTHPEARDYLITVEKISDFNKAQQDVLSRGFLDYNSNFVIATHTGTGKTALAHLRIVDTLKNNQKVIYICSHKAIAEEKNKDFSFYSKYGWKSISSTELDETKDRVEYSKYRIICMTYEKFDSVLNKASTQDWMHDVGLLVVDEGHMIADKNRGSTLEAALTKILMTYQNKMRVILLSAVLPNVEDVARWLKANHATSEWRPVDLEVGFAIFDETGKPSKRGKKSNNLTSSFGQGSTLQPRSKYDIMAGKMLARYGSIQKINSTISAGTSLMAPRQLEGKAVEHDEQIDQLLSSVLPLADVYDTVTEPVWSLSEKILRDKGQVLVFAPDRRGAESLAERIAAALSMSQYNSEILTEEDRIKNEESIKNLSNEADRLTATIRNGVAYHHAGLSLSTRRIIEAAYRARNIKIVVCTTTLIAGVNLPATLVIFNKITRWGGKGQEPIPKRDFLNGCGRAGRPGYETRGRALFITDDIEKAIRYLLLPVEPVQSQFQPETIAFQTLAIIKRNFDAGMPFTTKAEIINFFAHSFYVASGQHINIDVAIDNLANMGMLKPYGESTQGGGVKGNTMEKFTITQVGYETVRFYLFITTGYLLSQMIRAIDSHLHGKAYVTEERWQSPKTLSDFTVIHTLMHAREIAGSTRTIKYVEDEEESYKSRHANEVILDREQFLDTDMEDGARRVLCTTMAFLDKMEMRDLDDKDSFDSKYVNFGTGDFASLQDLSEWLLSAAVSMTKVIVKDDSTQKRITRMLNILIARIQNGMVKENLLELCSIRGIGRVRSRALAHEGVFTLAQIMEPANRKKIVNALGSEKLAESTIKAAEKRSQSNTTKTNLYSSSSP